MLDVRTSLLVTSVISFIIQALKRLSGWLAVSISKDFSSTLTLQQNKLACLSLAFVRVSLMHA
jgi:hypothetical protein